MDSQTPIQPILLGDSATASRWGETLQREGILVGTIRPPTVPDGAARLRVTLSAAHTAEQVEVLLSVLAEIAAGEDA